jgi:predicted kinase
MPTLENNSFLRSRQHRCQAGRKRADARLPVRLSRFPCDPEHNTLALKKARRIRNSSGHAGRCRSDVPDPYKKSQARAVVSSRMESAHISTLYLSCGKIAAGKSTLARLLAARPATLFVSEDHWTSNLFSGDLRTIEDYAPCSARLRAAMGPHVVDILQHGLSVVLDFPANTVSHRDWMRSLITQANAAHELHLLDVPDAICKQRLRDRNTSGEHPFQVSETDYDLFTSYFVPPGPNEGFNIVIHTSYASRTGRTQWGRFAATRAGARYCLRSYARQCGLRPCRTP